jgi:hypothetical protein
MKTVMVRYTVKPDRAAENKRLIAAVFAQLAEQKPAGLRYNSYTLPDGVSFVHIASHPDGEGGLLTDLPAFKAFTAGIKDRCEVQPVTTQLSPVGSFG